MAIILSLYRDTKCLVVAKGAKDMQIGIDGASASTGVSV